MPLSSRPAKFHPLPETQPLAPRYDPAGDIHRRIRNRRLAWIIGGLALVIYLAGFLLPH